MSIYADLQNRVFDGLASKAAPAVDDALIIEDATTSRPKKITIGALPIDQSQVASSVVKVASNGAAAITATTGGIQLAGTTTGTKVIDTSGSFPGQRVHLVLLAASGGSYTLALDSGTLTIDGAGESPVVQRNDAGTGWVVVGLGGATIA
jgi:hypothetical protein